MYGGFAVMRSKRLRWALAFDVHFVPSPWLIDREGNVVAFETTLDEIDTRIAELLH